MRRRTFLASAAAAFAVRIPARATESAEGDGPQALRVLLGRGSAQTLDATSFAFGGRRYRGTFSTLPDGSIVSVVPLEQYLYSVVPREMPRSWPQAALQAQAILARTYVLQRSNPARDYDLVPSEADQVYTGIDAEHAETTAAVDATAGSVLRYNHGFAQIMYSSCCGGHTESSADAWGGAPLPYLRGVACTYCAPSPWYRWTQEVNLDRVREALSQLAQIGDLRNVALDEPDASGRAKYWTFAGSSAEERVKASDVRRSLGSRTVPSLLVRSVALGASPQADRTITIEGSGLGHGVGLCQWGARGMALAGAGLRGILNYYFPGTGIGDD